MNHQPKPTTAPEAPRCPTCGHPVVRIVWGMPSREAIEAAEQGRLLLGGCVVLGVDPEWGCTGPEPHVLYSADATLDITERQA